MKNLSEMQIYMFRLLVEYQEEFVRDIEIRSDQTFEDLHNFILESVGIDKGELASFHVCDQEWNRLKEITLVDMYQSEINDRSEANTPGIMDKSVLKDYLTKPKERLIYEYNYLNPQIFYLELVSIFKTDNLLSYPRLIRSQGELEIQDNAYKPDKGEDMSEQLIKNFNNILKGNLDNSDDD